MNKITTKYDYLLVDCYVDTISRKYIKRNHVDYMKLMSRIMTRFPFDKIEL